MSTRRAPAGEPISFEKYMSSPAYAELRGVDGIAATAKGSMLADERQRSLLFFIQAMSLRPGGISKFATDFVSAFPELDKGGQIYPDLPDSLARSPLIDEWNLDFEAPMNWEVPTRKFCMGELPQLLTELCINPEIVLSAGARVVKSLFDYQQKFSECASAALADTEVARQVFKILDRALQYRKMVVLEGEPGIGKSEAAKTWCEMHLGQARFVTLVGCVNKTSIFRTIGRALGISSGYMRGATEMQARVEDVLQRSRLCLVVDEAHFLFGQGERIYSRPEMIDWIDTALCNQGVPVALVATPQLTRRLHQAEKQTVWQSTQFRRRIKDFARLPLKPSDVDIEAVTRKLLPECDRTSVKLVVGHSKLSPWPLSWIANLVEDVRGLANGRPVKFGDIEEAIKQFRTPSDVAQATAFETPVPAQRSKQAPSRAVVPGVARGSALPLHPSRIIDADHFPDACKMPQ